MNSHSFKKTVSKIKGTKIIFTDYETASIRANILSSRSVSRYGKFTNWSSYVGTTPFLWNQADQKFVWNRSKTRLVNILAKVISEVQTLYLFVRFIYMQIHDHVPLMDLMLHFTWMSGYLVISILNLNLVNEGIDMVRFLNQFSRTIDKFEGEIH